MKLLVANRGEIAVRVLRAAADLGWEAVAVHSEDDADALHVRMAGEAVALPGAGPAAYLDAAALVRAAERAGCHAVHPGYGFLAESAEFARRCEEARLRFVGPHPSTLDALGDKAAALALAERCGVPVLPGTRAATALPEARALLERLGPGAALVVKALAGGGGRGLRVVTSADALADAFARCASEARAAFGSDALYVERYLPEARHVEVQVVGDGTGDVSHLFERECSLQRRHQKLVEVAPAPGLPPALRGRLVEASLRMARELRLRSLATFEFLVDASRGAPEPGFAFLEANPRIQVEHTVTEVVLGVDLVQAQLALAEGRPLAALGLAQADVPAPRGFAVEARVCAETLAADGSPRPAGGTLARFDLPAGPGVRVDTHAFAGMSTNPRFDSLLAKVVVHEPRGDFAAAVRRAHRALGEFLIEGVETNLPLLCALLSHPDVVAGRATTTFVAHLLPNLGDVPTFQRLFGTSPKFGGVVAPLQGTVVSVAVAPGEAVQRGRVVVVMEAMKMEHEIAAPCSGFVREVSVAPGDTILEGRALLFIEEAEVGAETRAAESAADPAHVRPDLLEVLERRALTEDAARPEAVARRRKTGQRTARENLADLCDPGSFVEYGRYAIAAQRRRRELDDLIRNTPADGLVAGVATVNAALFGEDAARCAVLSYDYTVLAGTQGLQNHRKKDRIFELAEEQRLPLVIFTEGGGGRPGDTDGSGVAGLDCWAFHDFGRLSGLVPLVGVNSGRCFAGNAALLGCCDVVIATENSNIGMGGPAMIEGGGLGVVRPDEIGPMSEQVRNGVVDVPVADEAEAVAVARRYLGYFQGALAGFECEDQRVLRHLVPENRLRIYDVRRVLETLCDTGSVLELRRAFGPGMVTALARIEGRPLGVVANDPAHLAGAITSDGADKAARFLQLCDAFDLPVLFLCDTPGIMVGPEAEKTALVRHAARMFVVGSNLSVPFMTIVLRKGYGLGAQAMAGGSFKAPFFTVAWPTGEFGGMGLEGAVKLGYRKELEAIGDPEARGRLYEQMVARMYEHGKALSMASHFEIDDVVDPAESRTWVLRALRAAPPPAPRTGKKRRNVDTW